MSDQKLEKIKLLQSVHVNNIEKEHELAKDLAVLYQNKPGVEEESVADMVNRIEADFFPNQ